MYPESGSSGAFVRTVSETGRPRPAALGAACRRDVRAIGESGLVFGGLFHPILLTVASEHTESVFGAVSAADYSFPPRIADRKRNHLSVAEFRISPVVGFCFYNVIAVIAVISFLRFYNMDFLDGNPTRLAFV